MLDLRIVYDRLRSPENRIYLGVIVAMLAICLIVGCLILYQFIRGAAQTATPQLVLAPTPLAPLAVEPTQTAQVLVIPETSTPPVLKKINKAAGTKVKPTARPKAAAGQSCNYSSLRLNQILSPVPSGSWSPIEHYVCNDGYWEIGTADVVDRVTGGWGSDGVAEKILLKYDSSGNITDRIFIDPDGNQFPGPKQ